VYWGGESPTVALVTCCNYEIFIASQACVYKLTLKIIGNDDIAFRQHEQSVVSSCEVHNTCSQHRFLGNSSDALVGFI